MELGFPGGVCGQNSTCQCRRRKRCGFSPWIGKIPWRRKWQRTPVFLPEKFHGQRSLAVYSPWGHQESDTTEWLSTYNMELKRSGIHYLNKNMLRKIEESNHSNVGCTCARWEKNICIWAEKFNMMEGPGKHSHPSSSVVCVAWKKYCLRPSKVFIDGKLSNVFQEGWIWISCRLFVFVLFLLS